MGNKLKYYLAEKKMSQNELSKKTGIAASSISNIANGKLFVYPKWREKISEALDVDEYELFGERVLTERQKKAMAEAEVLVGRYVTYWKKIYYADDSDEEYIYLIPLTKDWELDVVSERTIPLTEIRFVNEVKFEGE